MVSNRSKWWLQCTEAHKWLDYWERWSKLHRKGSFFSHCHTHCQCCKQRFEAISSSMKWHRCCYVHFSIFSCVQNNKCQQNLGEICNSQTPETPVYQLAIILGTERLWMLLKAHFDRMWCHQHNWIQISSVQSMPRKTFVWLWRRC